MPVGGSTWARGPQDPGETEETELPQGVQFSITQMPVVRVPPAPPTEAQQKLRREVPGPTRASS